MERGEKLEYAVKAFIVQRLACFEGPTEVAAAVKEEFGLEITKQGVAYYDPNRKPASIVEPGLRELFEKTREAFLTDVATIPIANKAVQLRALQKQLEKAERSPGANAMVVTLVEAAAAIAGTIAPGKHQHELSGPGGAAIPVATTATIILTGAPQGAPAQEAVGGVPLEGD